MSPDEETPGRHLAFAAVALGTFMSTLDASVVNVALPSMAREFGEGLGQVEWVVLSYLLTLVTSLLYAGRVADLWGLRWAYGVGLLLFGASSAACGLSREILSLSLFRAAQGVGGALLNAAGPAILTTLYPGRRRGQVLGLAGLAVSAGLASGPAIGGFVVSYLSWHWIFFPNVPISLFAAIVAFRVIPRGGRKEARLDWPGFFLLAGATSSFLFLVTRLQELRWPEALGLGSTTVVCSLLFLFVERRVPEPLVDLRLFRNRIFTGSAVAGFLVFVTLGAVNLVFPFFLQDAHALEPSEIGAILVAQPVALALVSPLSGWLSDRLGSTRGLAVTGALFEVVALLGFSFVTADESLALVTGNLAVLGLAMGIFQSPNNSALMGSVPRERLGTAGGLLASVRVGGLLVGNAVGGAAYLHASGGVPEGAVAGLQTSAFLGACTGVLAAIASLARGRSGARG